MLGKPCYPVLNIHIHSSRYKKFLGCLYLSTLINLIIIMSEKHLLNELLQLLISEVFCLMILSILDSSTLRLS